MNKFPFLLVVLLTSLTLFGENNNYLNTETIVYSKKKNIEIDAQSKIWAEKVINDLKLDGLSSYDKAQKINRFIYAEFKYNGKRRLNVSEIIEKRNGFCISHTLISILLLRSAGIPAKMAHEVHIIKRRTILSLIIGRYAKRNNDGINSYWHNDHVWVLFEHNGKWIPFDSSLGICGYNELIEKRYIKHKKLCKGMIEKWTGPPFVILAESGKGLSDMENISNQILLHPNLNNNFRMKNKWFELIKTFDGWTSGDFYKQYLEDDKIELIKRFSINWFKGR